MAILATGFLPNLLGIGVRERIEEYVTRRLDGAIEKELEERNCVGMELGILYNIKDRLEIQE